MNAAPVAAPPVAEPAGRSAAADARLSIGWLTAAAGIVALSLFMAQQSLRLPSGFGIEDLLGWTAADSVHAAVEDWCAATGHLRWRLAAAYVLLDTALFMPSYALALLVTVWRLRAALAPGRSLLGHGLRALLWPTALVTLALLLVTDAIENFGGVQRLMLSLPAFVGSLLLAALAGLALWSGATAEDRAARRRALRMFAVAVLAALVLTAWQAAAADGVCQAPGSGIAGDWPARAHHAKAALVALALLPLVVALVSWWFGLELDLPDQHAERAERARRRAAAMGLVGRSRYVLLLLALFAGLTLGLDQCRDVLLGLSDVAGGPPLDAWGWAWRLLVLALGALAAGLLSYSCWLWTRLAGMVRRLGAPAPEDSPLSTWAGEFARHWARALALVPLLLLALLTAFTMGDAVSAARLRADDNGLWVTGARIAMLLLFGTGSVFIGLCLLALRARLSLGEAKDYVNSAEDVRLLLWGRSQVQRSLRRTPLPAWAQRWAWIFDPVPLALLALALMLLLRAGAAFMPDTAAAAPATLVLVTLALCWWMAVLGWLSLVEQRHAFPWIVVPAAAIGLWTLAGWNDNHALGSGSLDTTALAATLAGLRRDGFIATLSLGLTGTIAWLAVTWRDRVLDDPPWRWALLSSAGRTITALLPVAVCLLVLHDLDRRASVHRITSPLPAAPALARAWPEWSAALPAVARTDGRLFLVASEGGGIRSAYWTAQVLRRHVEQVPYFRQRLFAISGVSGGAMGAAVFRACLRLTDAPAQPIPALPDETQKQRLRDCIEQRFERLDALSPLLGSLVFDDAFARLLPLPTGPGWFACRNPGCGQLSRALAFEREWMRVFPTLAEPLAPVGPGEPQLLFNGTSVETGARSVASTLSGDPALFPASRFLRESLGGEPSLVTAAHSAARFPFVNPLAAVPGSGHLIDGGYFDNSGAASLADLWRALVAAGVPPGWRPQAILVRNGQQSPACLAADPAGPPRRCIKREAGATPGPEHLDRATERQRLGLYADMLGPVLALVNVSGIGAHGRQAAALLRGELGEPGAVGDQARIVLHDQVEQGSLVPLGWYLSRPAREAMDEQARRLRLLPAE